MTDKMQEREEFCAKFIVGNVFDETMFLFLKKWFEENVKNQSDYIPHGNPERAKNFANWFGESKMVDENNNPLVLYP